MLSRSGLGLCCGCCCIGHDYDDGDGADVDGCGDELDGLGAGGRDGVMSLNPSN